MCAGDVTRNRVPAVPVHRQRASFVESSAMVSPLL